MNAHAKSVLRAVRAAGTGGIPLEALEAGGAVHPAGGNWIAGPSPRVAVAEEARNA